MRFPHNHEEHSERAENPLPFSSSCPESKRGTDVMESEENLDMFGCVSV